MNPIFNKNLHRCILVLCLVFPYPALAHNLWLNATDYCPEYSERTGAHTKIYVGFGHRFPVDDYLEKDKLEEFKMIGPNMTISDLDPEDGGFLTAALILKKEGGYTITAVTDKGFYTMYTEGERMHHKMGSKEGLKNVVLSLYYENYAKALINVGHPTQEAFSMPVGHSIEIVPMENPYQKKVGDTLALKVLHNGQPASFCPVSATYIGFSSKEDYAFANKTKSKGITTIRLIHAGQWIAMATVRTSATEELKAKCTEMKYTASISFEVP